MWEERKKQSVESMWRGILIRLDCGNLCRRRWDGRLGWRGVSEWHDDVWNELIGR